MRSNFKYVVYAALLGNLLLLVSTFESPGSVLSGAATIAFFALLVDTLLMLKGNLPINNIINTWEPDNAPTNWEEYRAKWFSIFQYRQIANILGFLSLLVGAVFGAK